MIKHFVEYFHPGVIATDTSNKQVSSRTINEALPIGEHTFGFRFYDQEVVMSGNKELKGKPENYWECYYIGIKKTLEQIKEHATPKDETTIYNMETNRYKALVETKFGQRIPLQEKDIVISGNIL